MVIESPSRANRRPPARPAQRAAGGAYTSGDKLRVAVVGTQVQYSRNGSVFYTSAQTITYPLLVDASLYNTGATLSGAVVATTP